MRENYSLKYFLSSECVRNLPYELVGSCRFDFAVVRKQMTLWNIFDWRNSSCTPFIIYDYKFLSPCLQLFRVLYWILLLVTRNTDFHICEVVLDSKVFIYDILFK